MIYILYDWYDDEQFSARPRCTVGLGRRDSIIAKYC